MIISVECSHCGQSYKVEDRLAGKRVKCKSCGKAFLVEVLDTPGFRREEEPSIARAPARSVESEARREVEQNEEEVAPQLPDYIEPKYIGDPVLVRRGWNPPYKVPLSLMLDQWLPLALFIGGLIWIFAATLDLHGAKPWIGWTHAFVLLGVAMAVVMPLINLGYRLAGRKAGFAPPPHSKFRAIASAAIPVAIIYVFWSIEGNVGAMLLGAIFGTLLFAGSSWLFLRLRPEQAVTALTYVGGCFAASTLISVLVIAGLHFGTLATMRAMHRLDRVGESPIARGFDWPAGSGTSVAEEHVATGPLTTGMASAGLTGDTVWEGASGTLMPAEANPVTQGASTGGTVADPATKPTTTPVATTVPAAEPVNPLPAPAVVATPSPLVTAVIDASNVGVFDEVVYAPFKSNKMAIVRKRGSEHDEVELWTVDPLSAATTRTFGHEAGAVVNYVLNADGVHIAAGVTWPKPAVRVWTFEQMIGQNWKDLRVDKRPGAPAVIGYMSGDLMAVDWRQDAGPHSLNVIDTAMDQPKRQFPLGTFSTNVHNTAMSADGKTVALVDLVKNQATMVLVDLTGNSPPRSLALKTIKTWSPPTSIAFSADGSRVAAYFEHGTGAIAVVVRVADRKVLTEHVFAELPLAEKRGGQAYVGRALDWIGNNTWLAYGRAVLDSATGQMIGELGIADVRSHAMVGADMVHLVVNSGGREQLVALKLEMGKMAGGK